LIAYESFGKYINKNILIRLRFRRTNISTQLNWKNLINLINFMRKLEAKWLLIMKNTINISIIVLKNHMKERKISQYYNGDMKINSKNDSQSFLNLQLKFFQFQL
jgi:hypothetical protein